MPSSYRTLTKIPLYHNDGSDKSHHRYSMESGNDKTKKGQRFEFLLHAANNEITDEAFRAQYRAEMGIDLPTMSTWKQYLDEIEKNRDKANLLSTEVHPLRNNSEHRRKLQNFHYHGPGLI